MENVSKALIIAFSAFVCVMALSLAVYLLGQVYNTAEILVYRSDSTRYYDNIEFDATTDMIGNSKPGAIRIVSAETIIPTLYRYNKENFCVKIYDDNLMQ